MIILDSFIDAAIDPNVSLGAYVIDELKGYSLSRAESRFCKGVSLELIPKKLLSLGAISTGLIGLAHDYFVGVSNCCLSSSWRNFI